MKQTIEFYYDIKIDMLDIIKDSYHFKYENFDYYFFLYKRNPKDLEDIISCSKYLLENGYLVHIIVLNNKNEYLTYIDEVPYILLKVQNTNEEYSIIDILQYNKKLVINDDLYVNKWAELWSEKIDYIENKLSIIEKNIQVYYSADYYIGLTETAIYYVNLINSKYKKSSLDKVVLSRKRIYFPNIHLNYFNPLSFIYDLEVRDVAEYIKSVFFKGFDAKEELICFLKCNQLSFYSYNMLFARLLYPSYYFDLFDLYVNKKENVDFLFIIDKQSDYEKFLKFAYGQISKYAPLEKIDYLIFEH